MGTIRYHDAVAYFWERVQKTATCWLWIGPRGGRYGQFNLAVDGHRRLGAHRYSYELHNGSIPDGMQVLHRCDNPPCVNPAHLFLGTDADNHADKAAKGRAASRSRNGAAKLTDAQFIELLERVAAGETQASVARGLGVTPQAVCQFLKRVQA